MAGVQKHNLRIVNRTDLQDANAKLKVLYNIDDIPNDYRDIESTEVFARKRIRVGQP